MTICRMRFACWIPKATDTHSELCNTLLFHRNNDCTNAPQCYIIRTLPALSAVNIVRSSNGGLQK
jgi:hypothetical protein